MEISQIVKEAFVEDPKACQIRNIFFRKMKIVDIVNYLIKTGRNCIAIVTRIFAVECVKNYRLRRIAFVIALHHRKFIQVCQ